MIVMCRLCGLNCRTRPWAVYLPIRGPRLKSTPSVKAPATPWTTPEAIESWKPKRSVSQPPALQPQAASRIQTTEPSSTASRRYAESRTRSSRAPDMIDAVVHENSRKDRKKTRLMLFVRFGPKVSLQGMPPWQATDVKSLEFGPIGGEPVWVQVYIHQPKEEKGGVTTAV